MVKTEYKFYNKNILSTLYFILPDEQNRCDTTPFKKVLNLSSGTSERSYKKGIKSEKKEKSFKIKIKEKNNVFCGSSSTHHHECSDRSDSLWLGFE